MQKIKTPVLVLILGIALETNAQKLQFTIDLGKQRLSSVRGVALGDSVFLTLDLLDYTGGPVTANKSFWLLPGGVHEFVDLPELTGKPLLNVATRKDSTYYYFIEESRKLATIKALVRSNNNARTISKQSIPLKAKIYASYVENGNLFLLTAKGSTFGLELVQVKGLQIASQRFFRLSFDLGKNPKASASFYLAGTSLQPGQAAAPIKIMKDKEAIFITVDETISQEDIEAPEKMAYKTYRTITARLDLKTGEVRHRLFFGSPAYFNSMIFDNHVFRLTLDGGFRVDIFNMTDGALKHYLFLSKEKNHPSHPLYTRNGRDLTVDVNNFIKRENSINAMVKSATQCFIVADTTQTGSLLLTLGASGAISLSSSPFLWYLPGLARLVALAVIMDLNDGPDLYHYFFVEGTLLKGFDFKIKTDLVRQQIDEYELSVTRKYKAKAYLSSPNFTYGIYYTDTDNSSTVEVIKFDR